jgi:putative membrane protein
MGGVMAGMGWWMLVWGLITVAVLILAALGIVAPVRHLPSTRAPRGPASPLSDRASQPGPADRSP